MTVIAEAGNTENPCLLALISKGYDLSYRDLKLPDPELGIEFIAERDGNRFSAFSSPALLGLVALYEMRGVCWQTQFDEEDEGPIHETSEKFILTSLPEWKDPEVKTKKRKSKVRK